MHHIRRLVYKMGFRPKPYSIFFSPSRDWIEGMKGAYKPIEDAMKNLQKKADK